MKADEHTWRQPGRGLAPAGRAWATCGDGAGRAVGGRKIPAIESPTFWTHQAGVAAFGVYSAASRITAQDCRAAQNRALTVIDFSPEHVAMIEPQPGQSHEVNPVTVAAEYGQAWTAIVGGEPIACAGLVPMWEGRAYAWALLSQPAGAHLLRLTREIRSRLDAARYARVEMAVDAGFVAGARWAGLLGFKCETPEPMRKFLPNGRDAYLYARTT